MEADETAAVAAVGAVVLRAATTTSVPEVLLVRRANPPLAGVWTLPGGRPEAGESLEQAVVRELSEETGLGVRVVRELAVVEIAREGFRYRIHDFLCVVVDALHEGAGSDALDLRWVPAEEEALRTLGVNEEAIAVVTGAVGGARRGSGIPPA